MTRTVRQMTDGQRDQLANKMGVAIPALSFDEAQGIIEAPKGAFESEVAAIFAKRRIVDSTIWMTIQNGVYGDIGVLKATIISAGCRVSDWAADLMSRPAFVLASQPTEVALVRTSVRALGFTRAIFLRDILTRAQERGYKLCLPEDGPQLRRQYTTQPNGEILWMGMEPISDSGGDSRVFYVDRSGSGLWLDTNWYVLDRQFDPDFEFVFRK